MIGYKADEAMNENRTPPQWTLLRLANAAQEEHKDCCKYLCGEVKLEVLINNDLSQDRMIQTQTQKN